MTKADMMASLDEVFTHRCSIADYLDDVISAAESLEGAPVVVGHSLAGLIVQKYLETQAAPAGVLLASVPPRGLGARSCWLTVPEAFPASGYSGQVQAATLRRARLRLTQTRPVISHLGLSAKQRSQLALLLGNKDTDHLAAHLRHSDPPRISNTFQPDEH